MPFPPTAPDQPAEIDADCLAMLRSLADLGMELACALQANALAQAKAATALGKPVPDSSVAAFDRTARCVRRTVLLLRHAARPLAQREGSSVSHRTAARKRILRAVQDTIGREAETGEQAERLNGELLERMESLELDDDIAHSPLSDIILDIARDLGLAAQAGLPPAVRRRTADVAALCAWAAAPPGTPACDLPPLPTPHAWGGMVLDHPDDHLDPKTMTDAQLDAAIEREDERDRLRGSG